MANGKSISAIIDPNDEAFDIEKLSPKEQQELREWAATKNITWDEIQALNDFKKLAGKDESDEPKKEDIVSVTQN